jgi:hypothetical protein
MGEDESRTGDDGGPTRLKGRVIPTMPVDDVEVAKRVLEMLGPVVDKYREKAGLKVLDVDNDDDDYAKGQGVEAGVATVIPPFGEQVNLVETSQGGASNASQAKDSAVAKSGSGPVQASSGQQHKPPAMAKQNPSQVCRKPKISALNGVCRAHTLKDLPIT